MQSNISCQDDALDCTRSKQVEKAWGFLSIAPDHTSVLRNVFKIWASTTVGGVNKSNALWATLLVKACSVKQPGEFQSVVQSRRLLTLLGPLQRPDTGPPHVSDAGEMKNRANERGDGPERSECNTSRNYPRNVNLTSCIHVLLSELDTRLARRMCFAVSKMWYVLSLSLQEGIGTSPRMHVKV